MPRAAVRAGDHASSVAIDLASNVIADIRAQLRQRSAGMTGFVGNKLYASVSPDNQYCHGAARDLTAKLAAAEFTAGFRAPDSRDSTAPVNSRASSARRTSIRGPRQRSGLTPAVGRKNRSPGSVILRAGD